MAKQLIVLHGPANSGKTTTLRHMIETLTGCTFPQKPQNYRVVFDYQGKKFAVSTTGDTIPDINNNIAFFNGNKPSVPIYQIVGGQLVNMNATQLKTLVFDVIISACQIDKAGANPTHIDIFIKSKGWDNDVHWIYKSRTKGSKALQPNAIDIITSLRIINSINK